MDHEKVTAFVTERPRSSAENTLADTVFHIYRYTYRYGQSVLGECPMEPEMKFRERAERYRRIARNMVDAKIASEIEKIADDYELSAMAQAGGREIAVRH